MYLFDLSKYYSPEYLFLLFLVPILFVIDLKNIRSIKIPISSYLLFKDTSQSLKAKFEWFPLLLKSLAFVYFIFALARPQDVTKYQDINNDGVDIVLALDTSESMNAIDMEWKGNEATRMMVVKNVVHDFIKSRQHDRIGMVVFGDEAYTQCPLSTDQDILSGYLDMIEVGMIGPATAIGNAIVTSVKRLKNSTAKSKIAILLTDGKNTSGAVSPKLAADLAKRKGIKIYTILVGSFRKRVPYMQKTPWGKRRIYAQFETDPDSLKEIAKTTGAKYFRATSTESLKEIYNTINLLEKSKIEVHEYSLRKEHFMDLIVPAILLYLIQFLLRQFIFVRVP